MFCGTCGTELRPNADTCEACGARIERKVTLFDPTARWVEAASVDQQQRAPVRFAQAIMVPAQRERDIPSEEDHDDRGQRQPHDISLLAELRRIPVRDRQILVALAAMLISLLLPWVIVGSSRVPAYRIGWPIVVVVIILVAAMALVAFPKRFLYTRALLSVPFALGAFALGSGVLVLAFTWVMARMGPGEPRAFEAPFSYPASTPLTVEVLSGRFLGPDIGCFLFLLAAAFLVYAGYQKFVHDFQTVTDSNPALLPWQRPSLPASSSTDLDDEPATTPDANAAARPATGSSPPSPRTRPYLRSAWGGAASSRTRPVSRTVRRR